MGKQARRGKIARVMSIKVDGLIAAAVHRARQAATLAVYAEPRQDDDSGASSNEAES